MFIGAVLAVVVVFGGIFVLYQTQEPETGEDDFEVDFGPVPTVDVDYTTPVEPGSILNECGVQETQYKRDLCWRFESLDEANAEKCLNIVERPDRIICIRAIARDFESEAVKEDIARCDSYFSESIEKGFACYEPVLIKMKSEKLAVCNEFFDDDEVQRFRCHAEVARELLDYSICDAMQVQAYKDNCYFILDFETQGHS